MSEDDRHQAEHPASFSNSGARNPNAPRPTDVDLDPAVIVVKHRPRGLSPLLLPPIAVVLLGGAFLGYRATESNWHGFSWEWLADSWSTPVELKHAPPQSHAEPASALALNTEPVPLPPAEDEPKLPEADQATKEKAEADKAVPDTDPIDDIRREAEKTKERIAELEKLKAEESRKLAATENERRQADRNANLNRRLQAGRRLPPDEIRKMLDEQQRRFQQQVAQMEAMQRRQMSQMAQRQRDLLRRWGMDGGDGRPGPPGRQPGVPGPNMFMGVPGGGGDGVTEYKEFRGPGGSHGFVMRRQFRLENKFQVPPKPGEGPTPPEPPSIPEDK